MQINWEQNKLHNFQDPIQNETAGLSIKTYILRISRK